MMLRLSLALAAGAISSLAGTPLPPVAVTPEPATFVLVGGGILVAAGIAKFRKSRR